MPQNLYAYLALLQNHINIRVCMLAGQQMLLCLQIVDRRRSISKAANASLHTLDSLFRHIGALYSTYKHTHSCCRPNTQTRVYFYSYSLTYECKQIVTQSSRRTKYLHSALCVRIEASPKTKLIVGNSLTAPK